MNIRKEISVNEQYSGECVLCRKEMTPIDIATQAIHELGAGRYTCIACLPLSPEDTAPEIFK